MNETKITKSMLDDEFIDEYMCETGKTIVDGTCQVVTDPTSSDFRELRSSVELVYVYSSLSLSE